MVNYNCIRCGYTTNDKSKMKSHFRRKTVCKPELNDVNIDEYKKDILEGKKITIITDHPKSSQIIPKHPKSSQIIPNHPKYFLKMKVLFLNVNIVRKDINIIII